MYYQAPVVTTTADVSIATSLVPMEQQPLETEQQQWETMELVELLDETGPVMVDDFQSIPPGQHQGRPPDCSNLCSYSCPTKFEFVNEPLDVCLLSSLFVPTDCVDNVPCLFDGDESTIADEDSDCPLSLPDWSWDLWGDTDFSIPCDDGPVQSHQSTLEHPLELWGATATGDDSCDFDDDVSSLPNWSRDVWEGPISTHPTVDEMVDEQSPCDDLMPALGPIGSITSTTHVLGCCHNGKHINQHLTVSLGEIACVLEPLVEPLFVQHPLPLPPPEPPPLTYGETQKHEEKFV